MQPLTTSVEAASQLPSDPSKYEQHQRRIRIGAEEPPTRGDDLLVPRLARVLV